MVARTAPAWPGSRPSAGGSTSWWRPADGSRPRGHGHRRVPRHRPVGAYGGGGYCWVGRRRARVRRGRRPAARDRGERVARCACCRATTGAPPHRRSSPGGGGSRSCSSATTPATSRWSRRRCGLAPPALARRLRVGPRVVGRRCTCSRGTSGISRTCRGTGRASSPSTVDDDRDAKPESWSRAATTSPSASRGFAPTGDALAFVARARRVDERVDVAPGDGRRAGGAARRAARARRAVVGSGPTVVRVVARRSARLASTATRTASVAWSSSPSRRSTRRPTCQGVARRPRLGRGGIACIRSGGRTAPQLTVLDPGDGAARRVASPRRAGRARRGGPARARRRSRGRAPTARPCTGCSGCPPAAGGRHRRPPPLLVDVHGGPTDQSHRRLEAPGPVLRLARLGGAEPELPRARPGTAATTAHALDHAWGVVDVADTVAGIRGRRPGGLGRRRPAPR